MITVGMNHNSAPQQLRGRFSIAPEQLAPALNRFREQMQRCHSRPEATLLSTCNRTELYCATDAARGNEHELVRPAVDWLAELGGLSGDKLLAYGYLKEDEHVARHAFRVASGLDSMVLGEPEILGQMKRAVDKAEQAGTLGRTLNQLFQRSFSVAKEVRSTTEIGAHSISMAAVSVRLAVQHFGALRGITLLLVGAGEMIEQVALHFAAHSPASIVVANRSAARAEAVARRCGAQTMSLTELPARLHQFDVVVSCTASVLPIIGLGAVERALKVRGGRTTLMIDLAVPRDIEPEVARLAGAHLYGIDDLGAMVHTAGEKRRSAVVHAEAIIERRVQSFVGWLDKRAAVPLIQALNAQADEWRAAEITRARRMLRRGVALDDVLAGLSNGLTQKMLHGIFTELNDADGSERARLAQTFSRVFLRESRRRCT